MRIFPLLAWFMMLITGEFVEAATFRVFDSKHFNLAAAPASELKQLVFSSVNTLPYRDTAAQVIYGRQLHVLVFLFGNKTHKVDVVRINVDARFKKISVVENYTLTAEDFAQQPLVTLKCPDPALEFIVFSPSSEPISQSISELVARAAVAHSLKVASYIGASATRQQYLNAMSCPLLKGNFYDGDGTVFLITARDGVISAMDFQTLLKKQFRFKVVNIWVACNSFRNPMKTTMLVDTQSQKFASGINSLEVGPSDRTGACAMLAAMAGKPMTTAFHLCNQRLDNKTDHWGFDGSGSDYFGI
jgi:hypothetical protein